MLDVLRFITCGSVGDGKSTLIGRLFRESKPIFEDHIHKLERASGKYGIQGKELEPALSMDGLQAERELDITIDVAYRSFSTERRKFIVVDTSGHEQLYTSNMAAGAYATDLAVLLVDARKGLLTQAKLHSRIVSMLGVRHIVLAINKMDMVDWSKGAFDAVVAEFLTLVTDFGFVSVRAIPMSALNGGNVAIRSEQAAWYVGPTLLDYLETVDVSNLGGLHPFRMPVQYVNRLNPEIREYCGCVALGSIAIGDAIRVVPGGAEARVKSIVVRRGEREVAGAGDAITITLDRNVDISCGQVISSVDDPIQISDQFEASVLCLSEHHLVPGRPYLIRLHAIQVGVTLTDIKYKLDISHGAHLATNTLGRNDIGQVTLYTSHPIPFESCKQTKTLGAFILLDRLTNETVGAGMINFALRRASNIHWQSLGVGKVARASLKSQKPACIWFTGLSGSGKSTIANLLEKRLHADGVHTYILDGDNLRHGLNRDLGFTEADRVENIRRVSEVAKLMVDAGLIVLVSFISPYRSERRLARELFEVGEFIEVFVDASLQECEERDPKGLYAKARKGELKNFTGIDSDYEMPESAEITLKTASITPEEGVNQLMAYMMSS